jgi:hypothetical protein
MVGRLLHRLRASAEVPLTRQVFAGNLPHPKDFSLTMSVNVSQTRMTMAEWTSLADPV